MICSCCGQEISEKSHSIEDGTKFVCDSCWNNPNLFFAEKVESDARLKLISELVKNELNPTETTKIQVIRLFQKNLEMYVGKAPAKILLKLCDVNTFQEKELTGYQRDLYKERTTELVEFLDECPVAVMPGLFASVRNAKFVPQSGDVGTLEIPQKKGSIWIIDGQHRLGGFEKIRDKFIFDQKLEVTPETYSALMDYELPIVFLNSQDSAQKIAATNNEKNVAAEDLERALFFIVNKTQRGINPSLRDALLYRIKMGGLDGIPALKKDNWRIEGAAIAISLNNDKNSPLYDLINVSGKRLKGKPIQLNSFVSSLEKILRDQVFSTLSNEQQTRFITVYWKVLNKLIPGAFELETSKEYMVLKALGAYTLNWVALDVFQQLNSRELNIFDEDLILKLLNPLNTFDWNVKTSPLSKLGGMKGVNEAHKILLEHLAAKSSKNYPVKKEIRKINNFFNNS